MSAAGMEHLPHPGVTDRFKDTMRNAREDRQEVWPKNAEESLLGTFARGLRRDMVEPSSGSTKLVYRPALNAQPSHA